MLDIINEIKRWATEEKPFALATVIKTWGSSPRQIGSVMAISVNMQITGSVSGGCVETEVINEALDTIKNGKSRILEFGVSDNKAWSVGLSCGGSIKILVEKYPAFSDDPKKQEVWNRLIQAIEKNNPCILLRKLSEQKDNSHSYLLVYPDGNHFGNWGNHTNRAKEIALRQYEDRKSCVTQIDDLEIFVQIFPRKQKLVIIGGSHISIPLVKFAHELNFESIVIDPRKVFASADRFPVQPDKVIADWPQNILSNLDLNEDTYAVVLTHDPKIDDEGLKILLRSDVGYIGALGSKKTHAKRCARLKEADFSDEELARIQAPVGLDINASSPSEIALSIIGQIIETKNAITGRQKVKFKRKKV